MRFDILTLFPEVTNTVLSSSIIGRAVQNGIIEVQSHNIRDYTQFADPIIIDAVRWHTTGHAGMTLTEKLLYLADYIDDSRTFSSCVLLRRYFFGAEPELMTKEERERHLRATLLLSYEHTLKDLLAEGAPIDEDTIRARNELLVEAARDIK